MQVNRMARDTVIITVLNMLPAAINILLLPLLTGFLSKEEYGYFSLLGNLSLFFGIISGLNLASSVAPFYKQFTSDDELLKFIGKLVSFSLFFNAGLLVVIVLAGPFLAAGIFREKTHFFPDVFLAVSTGLFGNALLIFTYFQRYTKKIRVFSIFSVLQIIFLVGLQLAAVLWIKRGVTGIMYARFFAMIVMLALALIVYRKVLTLSIRNEPWLRKALSYSLLTCPAMLITWLTTYGDRFIIDRYFDLAHVGEYSFLVTICSVAEITFFAFNSALQPYIFDRMAEEKPYVISFYRLFAFMSMLVISVIILLATNIDLVVKNKEYLSALPYVIPMATGFIFSSMSVLFALQITFSQKGKYYLFISFFGLTASLAINFFLIPGNGLPGAVAANSLIKLTIASVIFYFAHRSLRIRGNREIIFWVAGFVFLEFLFWMAAETGFLSYKFTALLQFLVVLTTGLFLYKAQLRDMTSALWKR